MSLWLCEDALSGWQKLSSRPKIGPDVYCMEDSNPPFLLFLQQGEALGGVGLCPDNLEILPKSAVVAASSLLVGKMRAAPEVTTSSHALDEVVAVVDDVGSGGLEVLSVLPAEVCPGTARRYLDDAAPVW